MRIQSITNSNFRGMYELVREDPTTGKKYYQYRPYSWENGNSSTAEQPKLVDIMAHELPNNEQVELTREIDGILKEKVYTDIFGNMTSVYDVMGDKTENYVIESTEPSINREKSIAEFIKKLEAFRTMKFGYKEKLLSEKAYLYDQISSLNQKFLENYRDYNQGIFVARNTRRQNVDSMKTIHNAIMNKFESIKELEEKIKDMYVSIAAVGRQIRKLQDEADIIERARESNKLIDISQMDMKDVDVSKRIVEVLRENFQKINGCFIMLPNKTISINRIYSQMRTKGKEFSIWQNVADYIIEMIKSGK